MPLNVLFTVDTEFYPIHKNWRTDSFAFDIRRDIYGDTPHGSFGLTYQLDVFARHGIKAVFFLETLHASCAQVGIAPLKEIVQLIYSYGQEIQLHVHPEWIPFLEASPVEDRGDLLTYYSEEEQYRLIDRAANNLVNAGGKQPIAFRSGDFAANQSTLRALQRAGFRYDSSYNFPYLNTTCAIDGGPHWQPVLLEPELCEIPISCFQARRRHFRHCQVCACSASEIINSVRQAAERSWQTFVILSHSFEMVDNRRPQRTTWPRWRVIKRFEEECAWLASDDCPAVTRHFSDLNLIGNSLMSNSVGPPLRGRTADRMLRNYEQAMDRFTSHFNL